MAGHDPVGDLRFVRDHITCALHRVLFVGLEESKPIRQLDDEDRISRISEGSEQWSIGLRCHTGPTKEDQPGATTGECRTEFQRRASIQNGDVVSRAQQRIVDSPGSYRIGEPRGGRDGPHEESVTNPAANSAGPAARRDWRFRHDLERRRAMIASPSISTSITGSINARTSTMLVAGRISANTSPCARPTACQSRPMLTTNMRVRTTSSNVAPALARAAPMFVSVCFAWR